MAILEEKAMKQILAVELIGRLGADLLRYAMHSIMKTPLDIEYLDETTVQLSHKLLPNLPSWFGTHLLDFRGYKETIESKFDPKLVIPNQTIFELITLNIFNLFLAQSKASDETWRKFIMPMVTDSAIRSVWMAQPASLRSHSAPWVSISRTECPMGLLFSSLCFHCGTRWVVDESDLEHLFETNVSYPFQPHLLSDPEVLTSLSHHQVISNMPVFPTLRSLSPLPSKIVETSDVCADLGWQSFIRTVLILTLNKMIKQCLLSHWNQDVQIFLNKRPQFLQVAMTAEQSAAKASPHRHWTLRLKATEQWCRLLASEREWQTVTKTSRILVIQHPINAESVSLRHR
eukprot:Blabericola_migrator_1__8689@NODE_4573_length_1078_cov_2_388724_g2841_i0_p1_GENE_NODE_4573_length_1078_cov_2_388724_g2841_i0NODE_4573_length_1078_cov_2_388724_g2841_i0_p1_ORF_typecomplete_len345_score68_13_NODE_4573_length_1078_cov_2_388724_g2841_i0441078